MIYEYISKICQKNLSFIKIWQKRRVFTRRCIYIHDMKNVSGICCTENQNAHFMFKFFFPENLCVCEIVCENIIQPDRPQMTIWRIRFTCCITLQTHTQNMQYLFILQCKNVYENVHQCYVILTFTDWFINISRRKANVCFNAHSTVNQRL